jgi:hypothetical protein
VWNSAPPTVAERLQKKGVVRGFITSDPSTAAALFQWRTEAIRRASGMPRPKVGKTPRKTPKANPRPTWTGSPSTRTSRR